MFSKAMFALSAASMIALSTAASARDHDRDWGGRHDRNYSDSYRNAARSYDYRNAGYRNYGNAYPRYRSYGYAYPRAQTVVSVGYPAYGYYGGYGYPSYGYGYPAYGYAYPGYGYPAYGYNGGYGYQCGNTAAGAVAGGIAGAAIGAAVGNDGHHYINRYGYRRYNSGNRGATAAIGGVLGAVVGSAIAQGNCY
jgi:hypothetical protein